MSREGLESLPSRAWSCSTLLQGIETAAGIAGVTLEPGKALDQNQAQPRDSAVKMFFIYGYFKIRFFLTYSHYSLIHPHVAWTWSLTTSCTSGALCVYNPFSWLFQVSALLSALATKPADATWLLMWQGMQEEWNRCMRWKHALCNMTWPTFTHIYKC